MSTKAKSPRKPLTPAQKAAKAAKAKATREKKAAEELAAKEAEEKANNIEAEPEDIEPETVEAVVEALKSGQFQDVPNLTSSIDDTHPWKEEVISKAEKVKEAAEKKAEEDRIAKEKADKSIRPAKQPKVITFDEVMKKWGALVDILKAYSNQQQKAGRAWRHIYQGYHVVNQHMLRFKRNRPE